MRHWSQLATRNWRVKRVRTLGAVLAIALGAGAVVWVTCCFESVRRTVLVWAGDYVGRSHITVESPLGKYDTISQDLQGRIAEVEGVKHVTSRLVQRLRGIPMTKLPEGEKRGKTRWNEKTTPEVDFHGLDMQREHFVREYTASKGRMLTADDRGQCVVEAGFAAEYGVDVGDVVLVWGGARPDDSPEELEIVGLVNRRRIARFQKALVLVPIRKLQEINAKSRMVTSVDVVLHHSDTQSVRRGVELIRKVVNKATAVQPKPNVTSTEARLEQIRKAQAQQEVVLVLMSSVAMLTALFIILSTLSMGMVERIVQLGLMRCIGVTGVQLSVLVLVEVIPLGLLGVAAGIPIGLGLTALTVQLVPDYVGTFAISWNGIGMAIVAGLATILVAALLPAIATLSVSPLEAAHPRARKPRTWRLFLAGGFALLTVGAWYLVVHGAPAPLAPIVAPLFKPVKWISGLDLAVEGVRRSPEFLSFSIVAVVLLYLAYALIAPLLVWSIGTPAVALVAWITRVRFRLLQDQIGHAAWRSAGICCGLMVGLSLIVALITFSESFTTSWQFPKKFPEAYIWSFEQMSADPAGVISEVNRQAATQPTGGGVRDFTAANALNVVVEEQPMFMSKVYLSVTWFLGIEPESFLDLVRLEFLDGDPHEAVEKLKSGKHILIASDFARARNKKVGDRVKVSLGQGQPFHDFTVAGVIESPALDMAAGYFQASSEAKVVAVGSVIGTNRDLQQVFGAKGTKLVLLNFATPNPVPPGWPPQKNTPEFRALSEGANDESLPIERRWQRQHEETVLHGVRESMNPQAFSGTTRELKDQIDRELSTVMRVLTAVPAVALIVAAVGVANLMTANVTSRIKQLAILRAVGATRGLILRMVIGEGLVIGVLGSALGLGLGLHLAWNVTTMAERMWGLRVAIEMPWGYVIASILLTVGLCVLAGILPARHASRTNVVDALHVA